MLFCFSTFMYVLKRDSPRHKGVSYTAALSSTWGKKGSERPSNPTQGHIAKMAQVGGEPASSSSKFTGPLEAELYHQHHFLPNSTLTHGGGGGGGAVAIEPGA